MWARHFWNAQGARAQTPSWRPHRMYSSAELLELRRGMWRLREAGLIRMSTMLEGLEALDCLERGQNARGPNEALRAVMAEATAS